MATSTPKKPKLDWPAIVAEVHRKGMTLTELSKRAGLTPTACGRVKGTTHYGGQKAIADFLGEKPEDLWPNRYPRKGSRILDTNKYPPVDSQKTGAGVDSKAVA